MDGHQIISLGKFDTLFNKSVPHILEEIFFGLDYDSFMSCSKVCKTWNVLLSTESYHARSEELLLVKNKREEEFCDHIINGDVDEISNLITSGVKPNCKRGSPLYNAIRNGHDHVVKLLLDAGADPNLDPLTPLCIVISGNWQMRLHVSIHHMERPFRCGDCAISFSTKGHLLKHERLAEHFNKVNISQTRALPMVKMLLEAGANPNKASMWETPLETAVRMHYIDVVKLLLDYGAEPNMTNNQGETPLHTVLSDWRHEWRRPPTELVKLLLDAGANPNQTNNNGVTPLQEANIKGNVNIAKMLLEAGAKQTR